MLENVYSATSRCMYLSTPFDLQRAIFSSRDLSIGRTNAMVADVFELCKLILSTFRDARMMRLASNASRHSYVAWRESTCLPLFVSLPHHFFYGVENSNLSSRSRDLHFFDAEIKAHGTHIEKCTIRMITSMLF